MVCKTVHLTARVGACAVS